MNCFCYVGYMVTDSFKVFDAEQDLSARSDPMWILAHIDEGFIKKRIVERIDL